MIRLWGRNTFSALRVVPFRWLLVGRLATFMGWQTGSLALNWLVYSISGSALTLGWVNTGWSVATLAFALVGGFVADSADKKRLMVLGQAGLGITPVVVAVLALLGHLPIWVLAAHSLALGLFFSFIMPAREAYTTELMGRGALLNAMALMTMAIDVTGIFASPLAGMLVDRLGPAVAFLVVAALYESAAFCVLWLPSSDHAKVSSQSVGREFMAGIRYIVRQPILLAILGVELGRVLFLQPHQTLLPVFAADVFRRGAVGLGLMAAASSLGGVVGCLLVASLGDYRRRGWLLLTSGGASSLALLSFARMPLFYPALACLLLLSVASSAYMVTRSAVLQTTVGPQMRGRIVGFWRVIWGMAPLGTLPAGALADRWGAPLTVSVQALISLAMFVGLLLAVPRLRRLE